MTVTALDLALTGEPQERLLVLFAATDAAIQRYSEAVGDPRLASYNVMAMARTCPTLAAALRVPLPVRPLWAASGRC